MNWLRSRRPCWGWPLCDVPVCPAGHRMEPSAERAALRPVEGCSELRRHQSNPGVVRAQRRRSSGYGGAKAPAGECPDGLDGGAAGRRRAAHAQPDRGRAAPRVRCFCPGPHGAGAVRNGAIRSDAHGVGALLCSARPVRAVDVWRLVAGGPGACHCPRGPTEKRGRRGDPGRSCRGSGGASGPRNRGRPGTHVAVATLPAGAARRVPRPSSARPPKCG